MSNTLVAPWKIAFSDAVAGPYAVKVKLADLLFEPPKDPQKPLERRSWVEAGGGLRLPHDILAYRSQVYTDDGILDHTASLEDRKKYGVFLTSVKYAANGMPLSVVEDERYPNNSYKIYNPDYSLALTEDAFKERGRSFNVVVDNDDAWKTSVSVGVENNADQNLGDLGSNIPAFYFCGVDAAIDSTIPANTASPYTAARLNIPLDSQYIKLESEIVDLVKFFTHFGLRNEDNLLDHKTEVIPIDEIVTGMLDLSVNTALQSVEVWLTCSWFGDYVDPKSFAQELHEEANVRHKQLIIGTGDFSKYSEQAADNVHPYVPHTTPREDVLQDIPDEIIGSLLIPAQDQTIAQPVGWYDKDKTTEDNLQNNVKVPIDGNAYISGRIFSPTIDELWIMVKKLISGRAADTDGTQTGTYPTTENAQYSSATDTRLVSEPVFDLQLDGKKYGDPLDKENIVAVSAPQGIKYELHPNLVNIVEKYGNDISDYLPFEEPLVLTTQDGKTINLEDLKRVPERELVTAKLWNVRDKPLSLRELETAIKDQQYNLQAVLNYLLVTKVSKDSGQTSGGLDQLHREHQPNANNTSNTIWTTAEDTEVVFETDGISGEEKDYGDVLPISSGDTPNRYNRLEHQNISDIYLAADGTWRYIFDHVRLPVIDDKY